MKNELDETLEKELDFALANREQLAEEQRAARHAELNAPENAEEIETLTAAMAIARELYNARIAAKLTQQELAEKMNVSQPLIARLERGRGNLSIKTIRKYAAACGRRITLTLL